MSSRFWRAGGNAIGPNSSFLADTGGGSGTVWSPATDWTITNVGLTAERTANTGFWAQIRASATKTNGTWIATINFLDGGSFPGAVGLDDGTETQFLGHNTDGSSIGYWPAGNIVYVGSTIATGATYTVGDVIKVVKAGASVSFYKNNVLQATIVTTDLAYSASNPMTGNRYPALSNGNATGMKVTADFSGW